MRKDVIRLVSLLLAVFLVAGCAGATGSQGAAPAPKQAAPTAQAPKAAEAPKPQEAAKPAEAAKPQEAAKAAGPVELRSIWWGTQDRHDRTIKAWELYSGKNPNIKVTSEFSEWNAYWDKITVKVASGDAPDLIQMDYAYLNEYAGRGALLDLNSMVGKELDLSTMDKQLVESGKVDGKLYAICLGGNTMAMHVNKTILDKAGLQVPPIDWTWKDFEEMGRQVKAKLGSEGYYFSTDQSGGTNTFMYWLHMKATGKSLYNGVQFGFTEADLVEWYKVWEGYRKDGIAPTGEVTAAHGGSMPPLEQSLWTKQKTPLQWGWANEYERYATVIKDEIVATSYPRGGAAEAHYPKCSQFFSLSSQTRYPKEAAALVSWMINDPEASKVLAANRGVPVTVPSREALKAAGLSQYDKVAFDITEKITSFAGPTPPPEPKGHADVIKLFVRTAEEIQFGRKTAEAGAKEVMDEGSAILKKVNQ
jgi:multiple sugar transport system substrate-binding protein